MNAAIKIGGFVLALVGVFGVTYLTGTQAATLLAPVDAQSHDFAVKGLEPSVDGYTVSDTVTGDHEAGHQMVTVMITSPGGGPLTTLDPVDNEIMHLIAYREDLRGYQHLTPSRDEAGRWTAELLLTPGPWRLVYDFQPSALGEEVTLGLKINIAGEYAAEPIDPPTPVVDQGFYQVRIVETLAVQAEGNVTLDVSRKSKPVTDLSSLYGSLGHGVLVRPSDGGSIHLHPELGSGGTGPTITFSGGVPEAGTYRGFFEFSHDHLRFLIEATVEVS